MRAMAEGVGNGSTYATREQLLRAPRRSYEGTFGLVLGKVDSYLVVLAVERGSEAAAASIRPGEVLLSVDGQSTAGHDIPEVRAWMEAVLDGDIFLTLVGPDQTRRVTLNRSSLTTVRAIGCRVLDRSILYLRVKAFTYGTPGQMREAAESAGSMALQLILDLRGNHDGPIESAFVASDLFIRDGELGEMVGRAGRARRVANPAGPLEQSRVVVLVDRQTQGGAELLAANIQDHHRGQVVGQKTAGIAELHQAWPMAAGDLVQIAVGRVLRAGGAPLSRVGVTPDVELGQDAGAPRGEFGDVSCPGTSSGTAVRADPVVAQAVQLLSPR